MTILVGAIASFVLMIQAISERDQKAIALREALEAMQEATEARRQVELFADRMISANLLVASGQAHSDVLVQECFQAVSMQCKCSIMENTAFQEIYVE